MKIFTIPKVFMVVVSLMVMGSCAVYKDPVYITAIDQGLHMGPENKVGRDLLVSGPEAAYQASESTGERLTHMSRPTSAPGIPGTTAPVVIVSTPTGPTLVQPPKTQVIEACDRIVPPVIGLIPRLGPVEIAAISQSSTVDANSKLLDELELIYKYASGKNKELQNSFVKQWSSCRKVTVILQ